MFFEMTHLVTTTANQKVNSTEFPLAIEIQNIFDVVSIYFPDTSCVFTSPDRLRGTAVFHHSSEAAALLPRLRGSGGARSKKAFAATKEGRLETPM